MGLRSKISGFKRAALSVGRLRPLVKVYAQLRRVEHLIVQAILRTFPLQLLRIVGITIKYIWYIQAGRGNDRRPLVSVVHLDALKRPLRDSLIIMHRSVVQAVAEKRPWVWMVFVFGEGETRILPGDLLSASQRLDMVSQVHIFWSKKSAIDYVQVFAHEEDRAGIIEKIENKDVSDIVTGSDLTAFSVSACGSDSYRFPHQLVVKGRDFLKLFNPGSVIAVVSLPPFSSEGLASYSEKHKWLEMIAGAAQGIPRLQLVVSGFASPGNDDLHDLARGAAFTSNLGFSLSEEMVLAKHADFYIGPMDHFAMIAIDAGKPCMIIGEEGSVSAVDGDFGSHVRTFPDIGLEDPESFSRELRSFLSDAQKAGFIPVARVDWIEKVNGNA